MIDAARLEPSVLGLVEVARLLLRDRRPLSTATFDVWVGADSTATLHAELAVVP